MYKTARCKLLTLGVITSILFACQAHGPETPDTASNIVPQFWQSIPPSTHTQVSSDWQHGDKVGIFMAQSVHILYANIPYQINAKGYLLPTNNSPFRYPADGSSVQFYAYYPYRDQLNEPKISINLHKEENLLYAHYPNAHRSAPTISLIFKPQLAKVVFEIQPKNTQAKATLKEIPYEGLFDLSTGIFTSTGATHDIEIQDGKEMVLIPTSQLKIALTYAGKSIEKALQINLKAGKITTIPINIQTSVKSSTATLHIKPFSTKDYL